MDLEMLLMLNLLSNSVEKQTKINNLQDENKKLKKELENFKKNNKNKYL